MSNQLTKHHLDSLKNHHLVIVNSENSTELLEQARLDEYFSQIYPVQRQGTSITIAQIRDLKQLMNKSHGSNETTLVWIEHADSMTPEAQNAALKLFEEPAEGVHFVLSVARGASLLPTVVSRAIVIPMTSQSTKDQLTSSQLTDIDAQQLALLLEGTHVDAHALKVDQGYRQAKISSFSLAKAFLGGSTQQKLIIIKDVKDSSQAIEFVDAVYVLLKHMLKTSSEISPLLRSLDSCLEVMEALRTNANVKLQLTKLATVVSLK